MRFTRRLLPENLRGSSFAADGSSTRSLVPALATLGRCDCRAATIRDEHVVVRLVDAAGFGAAFVAQDDGVHEAAGAGDDRRAAAGATQDGDAARAAGVEVDLVGARDERPSTTSGVGDSQMRRYSASGSGGLGLVEQGLVEGDVFGGGVERQMEALHGVVLAHTGGARARRAGKPCELQIARG